MAVGSPQAPRWVYSLLYLASSTQFLDYLASLAEGSLAVEGPPRRREHRQAADSLHNAAAHTCLCRHTHTHTLGCLMEGPSSFSWKACHRTACVPKKKAVRFDKDLAYTHLQMGSGPGDSEEQVLQDCPVVLGVT